MPKKITQKEFIERAIETHGNKYNYSKVIYKNTSTKVCIICPIHGEFWQTPSNHLNGCKCPKCSHRSFTYTTQEFIEKAKQIHGEKYNYSKVNYIDNQTKVCIICSKHGEFYQTPNAHLNGQGCPKCGKEKLRKLYQFSTKEFIEKAKKIHGEKYNYSKVKYINYNTKVCIICPLHGEFWQTPSKHLIGQGCKECGRKTLIEKNRLTQEEFVKKAIELHGEKYDYSLSHYIDYDTPLKIICHEHGVFFQTPDSHLQGSGCQKCSHKESIQENNLGTFIKECLKDTEIETKKRGLFSNPLLEIDTYIPEKNIGIEYNGLRWHSERFGKDSNYHLNKTIKCEEKGIRLIHIFEDEWLEHEEIVKSKLRHIFGCDTNLPKIFARKCPIKEIDYLQARIFLEKNHIQGACNSSVYLGCFYKKKLIGVMSFRKEIKDSNNWELTRFATDNNFVCCGIGGKLFKHFIKQYSPNKIKSFADRRWHIDNEKSLYRKLGFKLSNILKPDYDYVVRNKRYHKFNFRKQLLLKKYPNEGLTKDMTEFEMTQKLGFYRIWNCGLLKYIWNKEEN